MEPIAKLNSYINSAIPYAWDDSESWFEFLAKVLKKVNDLVEASNEYFAVDLVAYTENLLAEWVENGRMTTLLNALIAHKANQTAMLEGDEAGIAYTDAKNTILQEMLAQQYAVLNAKIDDMASPAGTYADLAALILADPDHSKTYITLDDGKWCYHNGTTWVEGGVYQSTGIADYSITPKKTSFFKIGKNIFLIEEAKDGFYINQDTGVETENSAHVSTGYMPVVPGQLYIGNQTLQRYAFYDASKNFLSGGLGTQGSAFEAPSGSAFLRASHEKTSWTLSTLQIEQGSSITAYEVGRYLLTPEAILSIITGDADKQYRMMGGNIRTPIFDGDIYTIHNDSGHKAAGIHEVAIYGDDLRVIMPFTAKKVVSMNVSPHLSMQSMGYRCATTGGDTIHAIAFIRDVMVGGEGAFNGSLFELSANCVTSANDIELSTSVLPGGIVRIQHSKPFPGTYPTVSARGGYIPRLLTVADTYFDISWVGFDGVAITELDANCVAAFTRSGTIRVPAKDVVINGGSLWVWGLFEI